MTSEQTANGLSGWRTRWRDINLRLLGRGRWLTLALLSACLVSVLATILVWSGATPAEPSPGVVLTLLVADLVLLLCLGALLARQIVQLWAERRSGLAGSRLHMRFAAIFSLVAVAPAIFVAVFAALFFYLGVQSWFSERVRTAIGESLAVAEAYVAEHRSTIRGDLLAMANDINRQAGLFSRNRRLFNQVLSTQAAIRSLSEVTVFGSSGNILARTSFSLAATFDRVPSDVLARVSQVSAGGIIVGDSDEDQVRAMIRLDSFFDAYLYIARFVDPKVLDHVQSTREAVAAYEALEGARFDLQFTTSLIFFVVAFLLLLLAVGLGVSAASRVVRPISALIDAAERVRDGDLAARVDEGRDEDEIATLSRAFNRMAAQLGEQRQELVKANRQLDRRSRFTEAVLSGVSAGVVGLDREGVITLPNASAARLLETDVASLRGRRLVAAVPEMAPLLERARRGRMVEQQLALIRNGHRHIFHVRISPDQAPLGRANFIVTFDDVTELVSAQRTAAWADVAKRIAHEIKNPLTPIQLAAERLKRRYLGEVQSDAEIFSQCTDTIIRHVADIGRMIDEFSGFARMPAPVFANEDVNELIREVVFAQKLAYGEIDFNLHLPPGELQLRLDRRQLTQVLNNVLHNAAQAIRARDDSSPGAVPKGQIDIEIAEQHGDALILIVDNGIGLPEEDRDRLTEPYVTSKESGTGLGLAIVNKIMEDHGGRLTLNDMESGGAMIVLRLPLPVASEEDGEEETPTPQMDRAHGA